MMTPRRRECHALSCVLALVGVALAACANSRKRPREQDRPSVGIGFSLADDLRVVRGAILTEPPGREEAFLNWVASSTPAWIDSCWREPGASPVAFTVQTDEQGRPQSLPVPSTLSARDRCVAARAVASTPGAPLTARTRITVEIILR